MPLIRIMIIIITMTDVENKCDCGCGPGCGCSAGKRCSRRRRAVLQVLSSSPCHLTAEEVYRAAGKKLPGIGIATVYRSLKCLCGCGKARELKYGDHPAVYEAAGLKSPHGHLVCLNCGELKEFFEPAMEKLQAGLAAANGFSTAGGRLEIYGTCAKCSGLRKDKNEKDHRAGCCS
ncbi:MAG TPA: transcriptional repressor [Elusimicrobia bacterium]|nr:transcriptional repressor [Elusimicrobiota bacterium]